MFLLTAYSQMAKAGFVYTPSRPDKKTGAADDTATCFYCKTSLNGWDDGDDPLYETLSHLAIHVTNFESGKSTGNESRRTMPAPFWLLQKLLTPSQSPPLKRRPRLQRNLHLVSFHSLRADPHLWYKQKHPVNQAVRMKYWRPLLGKG